ncbi:MAG: NACHT domain-containing protein [Lamprobacter sp.]|uniref:NACHT domain-containing protein n=1 Tax=Lamprobacter sp. TaxID=3100796 RepID=UPI002B25AF97|nr:NACHT domain-containing protein [Lamprobacter sp.]MEA3643048.1 NACHT domain-containing protein [Lamprobacter sp.]
MSASQDDPKVRNARDLVERILGHPQGGIKVLLKLAEGQETEWLEFKAALYPEGGQFKDGEKADDYHWHVAKAAVALANMAGGAVILGLDDNLQPVGLAASDPKGTLTTKGREAFNRDILLPAVAGGQWKTGRSGTIRLDGSLASQIEILNADYHAHPLAVILVTPMPEDELLEVHELRNQERRFIPVRVPGAVGQVRDLHGRKEQRNYERTRENQLRGDRYAQLWQRFLASRPTETTATPANLIDEGVEQALSAYSVGFVKEWRFLRDLFTPLDLEERDTGAVPVHAREFVPEAEEWRDLFASDDPWENDDPGTDDEDDIEDEGTEPTQNPLRKGSVFDLLAQETRAILLGEPGAGKSTCLLRLALHHAEAYHDGATVALFVPLRLYTDDGLKALIARRCHQSWPITEALIQAGRLELLLDAVNECPRHLQERCCQDIKALLDTYTDLPVLITARNLSYRCELRLPTFIVRPLDAEQQQRFLTAYLRGDAARAGALLEQIQNQPGGTLIASSPYLLRTVVAVSRRQGELPQGRALLYRRFFEVWYEREESKEFETGTRLRWSFSRTLEALTNLALAARQIGRVEMDRTWAERTLHPLLAHDTAPFLERVAQGLLFQFDVEQNSLSFSHESIQEYLAAEALIRQPNALADVPGDDSSNWQMPLAYAFELSPDLPALLIEEAWCREPLLVSVALRDTQLLPSLPIPDDGNPWLTGVLRTLHGDSCAAESERIARDLLYPPVHTLPTILSKMLTSQAFWYAGLTHKNGIRRLERLSKLITECEEPWLDILPLACKGNELWKTSLSSTHANFLQCVETTSTDCNLHDLTIPQISYLRRNDLLRKSKIDDILKHKIVHEANSLQLLSTSIQ